MPRTPHTPAEIHAAPGPLPESHAITLAEERAAKAIESDMAFEAARMLGQIEALEFSRNISDLTQVQIFLNLKKNKAYRAISYEDADGNRKRISDLDEFCERFMGKSSRRMRQLAEQYHLLGAELYEQAQRIGFRTQDYTALKALPADDQEVIKQAIETDDRDTILSLMQELAAKHQSEKAALQAEATEAKETAEARDQVVKAKEAKISQQEETIHKLKRRIETATPDQIGEQLREEVSQFAFGAEAQILGNLRQGFAALQEHADTHGMTHENFMSGCLAQIEAAVATVRAEFGVKARPDADPVPDWVKDERPADEIVNEALGDELADFNRRMAANG